MKLIQICVHRSGGILCSAQHIGYGPSICYNHQLINLYQHLVAKNFSCISRALLDSRGLVVKQLPKYLQGTSGGMCVDFSSNSKTLQQLRNPRSSGKSSNRGERENADSDESAKEWHKNQMLRVSMENDILSRHRNSFIMTLVALSAIQAESIPLNLTISGIAVVTAEMNLIFGTFAYLSNLYNMRKGRKLSTMVFVFHFLWAIVPFVLWSVILGFLLPSGKKLDTELRNYVGEDE